MWKKSKAVVKTKPASLPPAQYVRAEVNLLRYPFFALTTRDLQKVEKIPFPHYISIQLIA
jgi:hypothetical protein